MQQVTYEKTLFDIDDAILNEEYTGFKEDYLVLHSLIRKFLPSSILEIGTNMGTGTNILCNAIRDGKVYSLDLPTELAHISLQHPISEGKGDSVGHRCTFPYTQLRGDSMKFDFSKYPCEAYFIDGEHDYQHVYKESTEVFKLNPNLVVWHDADIQEVYNGIVDATPDNYTLYRVNGTRIAYAI